jgi:TP901 family phage tail tape measure protein
MADVNANIGVNIDTSEALAQLKALQRQISQFHSSIAKSSESATIAQKSLQKNLLGSINSIGAFSAELRTVRTSAESFTNSLEKNKFSMREYFRYAGASTKTFGRLFRSEFDTIGKVAEERVKTLQTQYIKMGRNASGAMEAIAIRPTSLNMQDYGTRTAIAAQKQALFNQLMKQGTTNLLNFGKNTQWAGRQLMVGFTIPLSIVGSTATKTFMDMEVQALKFKKVYGDLFTPKAETQAALDNITELGRQFTKYGIAVSQTVGLAAEAAAAGFQGLDLQRQTTEATRLSVLGQVDSQKALETTISLQNAFGMSSDKLADSINFLNAVENQTVVSLDDITTAIPKVAPVIQQLGGDVKDLTFFIAAMKEGGINASEGANALKSGLAALINPTKKASEMLANFGINAKEIVVKNKGDLKATVIEFATALNQLDPLNRAQAIEQMFGKFQFARLSTLFANVAKDGNQAARVLSLANSSVQELSDLSEQELGMTADSSMNKFKKSVEDLKLALVPVGKAFLEAATPIVEFVGGILEKFGNLSDGTKKLITFLTVGIGAIGPIFLMTFGLVANAIANGLKGVMLLRQGYLRLTGQSQILGEQTQYLNTEQLEAAAAAHSLDQSHARLTQSFTAETAALQQLIAAYQSATRAGQSFMLNNPGMMMPPRGAVRKLASGIVSVPGPKGAGDIVPAMLSPGEAVIPAKFVEKYGPLIQGMVAGNIPGYEMGVGSVPGSLFGTEATFSRKATASRIEQVINQLDSAVKDLVVNAVPDIVESLKGASISVESFGKELQKRIQAGSINVPKSAIGGFGEKSYSAPAAIKKQTAAMDWQSRQKEEDAITEALKEYKLTLEQRNNIIGKDTAHIEQSLATGPSGEKIWDPTNLQADSSAINKYMEQAKGRMLQFANETDKVDDLVADVAKQLRMSSEAVKTRFSRLAGGNQPQTTADYALLSGFAAQDVKNPRNKTPYMAAAAGAVANVRVSDPSYVEALAKGDVTAYKKVVERQSREVVGATISATAQAAGTSSPSRKTIPIGEDIARGLEVGMANRQDDVARSGTNLANSAVGGVKTIPFRAPGQPVPTIPTTTTGAVAANVPMSKEVNEGVRATATNIKSMNDRLRSFDRGLMGSSFAISSLAGVASMSGGKLGEMSGSIFKVTTAMFALQAITSLLTQSGIARLATERGLTAGLLVRATTDSKAKIATGLFSGGIKQLLPNLLRFGGMIARFLGPVGLVLSGLLGLKKVVDLIKASKEKERMATEGLADAMTMTSDKVKFLAGLLGQTPTARAGSGARVSANQLNAAEQTAVDELRGNKEFLDKYKKDIEAIKTGTVEEAQIAFNSIALDLGGQGFTKDAVKAYIDALGEEAGKTDVAFKFKQIDLSTEEGKAAAIKLANDTATRFNEAFEGGIKKTRKVVGGGRGGVILGPETIDLSKEQQKELNIRSAALANTMTNLTSAFGNQTIKADEYNKQIAALATTIPKGTAGMLLLDKALLNVSPEISKASAGIQDYDSQMLLLRASLLNTFIPQDIFNRLLDKTPGVAEKARKELEKLTLAQDKMANQVVPTDPFKDTENTGTPKKSPFTLAKEDLIAQRKELKDTRVAYAKLKSVGMETGKAFEAAKNPILAAALATTKVGSTQWKTLLGLIKKVNAEAKNAPLSPEEMFDVVEKSIEAKYRNAIKTGEAAIETAQKTVDGIEKEISGIQNSIEKKQRNIELTFNRPIEALQSESSLLSEQLKDIDRAAEGINAKYDLQEKALTKISEINQEIAEQEKGRLGLADALSRGDIAAAASAAQQLRADAAKNAMGRSSGVLQAAREAEISGLRSATGLTKDQIAARQLEIEKQVFALEQQKATATAAIRLQEDQIYTIQQGKLLTAQNALVAARESLQKTIDLKDADLEVINQQKQYWEDKTTADELAKVRAIEYQNEIKKTQDKAQGVLDRILALNRTVTTTHIINTITTSSGSPATKGKPNMYGGKIMPMSMGGMVPKYMAVGGRIGSDTVPAMLTPGEFVINKKASQEFGPLLSMLNESKYPSMIGSSYDGQGAGIGAVTSVNDNSRSVYNYNVGINVPQSNANPNDIARAVIGQIKYIDNQRIRGQR